MVTPVDDLNFKRFCRSTCIEYLKNTENLGNVAIVYAYLRYDEKRTLRGILAALIDQLTSNLGVLALLEPHYRELKWEGVEFTEKGMGSFLQTIVGARSETQDRPQCPCQQFDDLERSSEEGDRGGLMADVFAVIDGLDEASEAVQDRLVRVLSLLNINLLIFSRPLDHVSRLHTPRANHVSIQARSQDIALYVKQQILESSRLGTVLGDNTELSGRLLERILQKANGMSVTTLLPFVTGSEGANHPRQVSSCQTADGVSRAKRQ